MDIQTATAAKPAIETSTRYTVSAAITLEMSDTSPIARLTRSATIGMPRRVRRVNARGA